MGDVKRRALLAAAALFAVHGVAETDYSVNCSFQADPDEFLNRQLRVRDEVFDRAGKIGRSIHAARAVNFAVPASSIPRRNLIDVEIFDKLAKSNVPSAPLSTDAEFFRRIHLDLNGRLPEPAAVRAFVADANPDKRNAVIQELLYTSAFIDKWTVWLGDLVQNAQVVNGFNVQAGGRNAFHAYLKAAIADSKPLKDVAWEIVTSRGNSFSPDTGGVSYMVGGRSSGPIQDSYDLTFARTAQIWLGMGHYDCIVCHDGRRRLDQLSLWGKNATRIDGYRMAAFFSRVRYAQDNDRNSPTVGSTNVSDATTGQYDLNTRFGNRPNRDPIGNIRNVTPEYHVTGAKPPDADWRAAFAENLIRDPMFARNLANRLWKAMFGMGLVEPVDGLDPARLDPAKTPEAPWTHQATHPKLLDLLAQELVQRNFGLREFLRLLTESSAYQLSSRYDGEWKPEYVQMFARHFPRRLDGEEIHDAIALATAIPGRYTVAGWGDPAESAMQLPEPVEPRTNGAVAAFMNSFFRGNRDTQPRSQSGSILQQLNLMNDAFVLNRTRVASSPALQRISRIANNSEAADELFLAFLARLPSEYEREQAMAILAQGTNATLRNQRIEDLAWALINKIEFLYSY
jgi:hypothetical protein